MFVILVKNRMVGGEGGSCVEERGGGEGGEVLGLYIDKTGIIAGEVVSFIVNHADKSVVGRDPALFDPVVFEMNGAGAVG